MIVNVPWEDKRWDGKGSVMKNDETKNNVDAVKSFLVDGNIFGNISWSIVILFVSSKWWCMATMCYITLAV